MNQFPHSGSVAAKRHAYRVPRATRCSMFATSTKPELEVFKKNVQTECYLAANDRVFGCVQSSLVNWLSETKDNEQQYLCES